MLLAKTKDEKAFGTGTIGIEIRRNKVQTTLTNSEKGKLAEGYFNWMGASILKDVAYNPKMAGLLGSIFENNISVNTERGFIIGPGAHNTVIKNNHLENVRIKLEEQVQEMKKTGAEIVVTDLK